MSGLVLLMLVCACGKQGEAPAEKAAKAKATATEAPPTATPTEEPTATPAPSPTPLPTSPPEAQEGAAAFLEKRAPRWGSRPPDDATSQEQV